ncbi:GNAT family N-acetyltransferase [Galactobacter valiniphilus]|uniref:GNAT family N-acetyltransferase n=1 Tax=Galactobacter valiniphilus TaxID=2676122 RepID=A0A399JCP5_9MICC|nr:bifunctional GNAT family N-acetyltransferase/acetate--CoA ligase family protein [Galactobacter valiniphilus]RII43004.1 GNAT family N-acetyltransferase [Galactobacter valiniphilus]
MASPRRFGAYPTRWEADVVLRDGSTAHVRPIRPSDVPALERLHAAQSERSIYLRYFTYKSSLTPAELKRFTEVDHVDRVALVVERGSEIIAIGRFDRLPDPTQAEVAFNVRDAEQGKGLGSILLEHLTAAGRELGIERFTAEVLPENRQMLTVFSEAGYDVTRSFEDGVVMVSFDIDPTERSLAVMEAREHRAEARSLAELLRPRSVAVIGASRTWGKLGHALLENVREGGFTGPVYAVNPQVLELGGGPAYGKVSEIPNPVDLAIVAVPKEEVLGVAADCAKHGVKGLVVITAGFRAEADLAGQRELVRLARANGMRVIGPASLGLFNTDPAVRLNASPSERPPRPGNVGLFSQSAALGMMLYAVAKRRGLGLSAGLNAGNRADVSGNDVMQFFEDDEHTEVVALYLESFGNPRKFSRIARRLARSKPVIVAKSDVMGLRVPPGHQARTTQAPQGAVNALLSQSGVIRVGTQEELMDVAQLLATQPLPAGPRLAVLSNSAALGAVAADHAAGLELVVSTQESEIELGSGQSVAVRAVRSACAQALARPDVDALLVALLPAVGVDPAALAAAIAGAGNAAGKPVIACFAGALGDEAPVAGVAGELPCYPNLAVGLKALSRARTYAAWRERDPGEVEEPAGIDRERARELVEGWVEGLQGDGLLSLSQEQCAQLLDCYGITVQRSIAFSTEEEAVAAAAQVGYPVVLKARDAALRHRLDLGGVRLNIVDEASLRSDVRSMREMLRPYGEVQLEVQAMAPTGQGVVVRCLEDPLMGPLVSYGLAGDAVNLLGDWAHAAPPLTPGVLHDLVRAPRSATKLLGYQGLPALDTGALEELLHRVGTLKDELPQVALLEFNPVLVAPRGVHVLHAQIRVGNPAERTDSARRAMSIPQR